MNIHTKKNIFRVGKVRYSVRIGFKAQTVLFNESIHIHDHMRFPTTKMIRLIAIKTSILVIRLDAVWLCIDENIESVYVTLNHFADGASV